MGLLSKVKSAATKSSSFFTTGSPNTFDSKTAAANPAPAAQTPASSSSGSSGSSKSSSGSSSGTSTRASFATFTYKPQFDHGGGGVVVDGPAKNIVVKDPNGNIVYQGNATSSNNEGTKFQLPTSKIPSGSSVSIDGGQSFQLKGPNQRVDYKTGGGGSSSGGSSGGGTTSDGAPSESGTGGAGEPTQHGFGVAPADLTSQFPSAAHVPQIQIPGATLPYTDPTAFAQNYAKTSNQIAEGTFGTSNDLALKELNTELQGMQNYVPAAQALKQQTTSVDNTFNQTARTNQINSVLPGVAANLDQQTKDAATYASGKVPDSVTDNALSLNARSTSASASAASGFGASSSVAEKASDLLNANQRIALSEYGNNLEQSNSTAQQGLKLAPTEYSNAGSEISAAPSLSGSQLASNNQSLLMGYGSLPVGSALSTQVGQNEFETNLNQNTQQFNANIGNNINQFNASADNNFALSKFGYQVSEAGAVAGADQTDINTQVALQQQQQYMQLMQQYMAQSQNTQLISSLFQGGSALLGGSGGFSNLVKSVGSLGGKGGKGSGTTSTSSNPAAIIGYPVPNADDLSGG